MKFIAFPPFSFIDRDLVRGIPRDLLRPQLVLHYDIITPNSLIVTLQRAEKLTGLASWRLRRGLRSYPAWFSRSTSCFSMLSVIRWY